MAAGHPAPESRRGRSRTRRLRPHRRSPRRSASRSASARARRSTTSRWSIPAGDSRALVGRNGAGKSTLVGVLTGLLAPDAGQVRFAGEAAPGLADRQSWRERVACVYQKSTIIPTLTVAENLFLNAHPTFAGGLDRLAGAAPAGASRCSRTGASRSTSMLDAARLTVEQRQIVEIARALLQGTRFIILDEPTAQLEAREVARLFERIARLQEGGVTFLYISHHLEEIYEVCRSVTVLRDGAVVANAPLATMPKERVVAAMVGDAVRDRGRAAPPVAAADRGGGVACLEVRGLCIPGAVGGPELRGRGRRDASGSPGSRARARSRSAKRSPGW